MSVNFFFACGCLIVPALIKKYPLPHWISFFYPCQKSVAHVCVVFPFLSFLSVPLVYILIPPPVTKYHTSGYCSYVVKLSIRQSNISHFILVRVVLAILISFSFHIHFRAIFSTCTKNLARVFRGINLGRIEIFMLAFQANGWIDSNPGFVSNPWIFI